MVRLISLYIEFDSQIHLALVSVRQKEKEFVCQVRYVNKSLHYKLMENLLVFDHNGRLKQPFSFSRNKENLLLDSTIKAISQHLQTA